MPTSARSQAWPLRLPAAAFSARWSRAFISHRRGIYYALLTIAFGQVSWFVAIKWHSVTGGEDGLLNIPRPPLDLGFVHVSPDVQRGAVLFRAGAVRGGRRGRCGDLSHSPFGRVLGAVKQNEMRAAYCGYNVWLYKWHRVRDVVRRSRDLPADCSRWRSSRRIRT